MIPARVYSSQTLALLDRVRDLKAAGHDVVSFAAGESDFPTSDIVVHEAFESVKRGNTRYVSPSGQMNLREAVAKDYRDRLGASWITAEHVLPTFGAKQGLYLVLASLLDPEDEVLVPKPYWVSYPGLVKACRGRVIEVTTQEANAFFPTAEELEKVYSPQTKALIFSSPSNPLGTMISESQLRDILAWCRRRRVTLIYDEIYERLVLDPAHRHVCPLALASEAESEYVVAVNATSKSLAMTGWRLGFVLGTKANLDNLRAMQSQMVTCLPGFIQDGAAAGLAQVDAILAPIIQAYRDRLKVLVEALEKIPGIRFVRPTGAFYVAVDVSGVVMRKGYRSDVEFAERLLAQEHLAVLAGTSMGMPGWIRLSFATSLDDVKRGVERLARFVS